MELQFQEYLNQKVTAANRKVILITGANSGIGYQATRMLAYKGAHVLMACRDKEKAEKARKELLKENKDALIDVLIYDQASLKTIDELKKEIQTYVKEHTAPYKYPRIVEFRDELPKTLSGKIRRVDLR